jgi:hypothetical protein
MKQWIVASLILFLTVSGLIGCKEEEYIHVGANWDALHKLKAPEKTFSVRVSGKDRAKVGENLSFKVTSEKNGRLWIVQVDSDDNLNLLFPNEKMSDNTISADKAFVIPPENAGWSIEATEPLGKSIVAFFVTTGNRDIQDIFSKESKGKDISKSLRLVEDSEEWGVEKLVFDTK